MNKSVPRIVLAATLFAAFSSSACVDQSAKKKLDELSARVEKLEKGGGGDRVGKIEKFLGRAAPGWEQMADQPPPPPPPPEPDPKLSYSVPVDGNPTRGAAAAQVTIVEAFDFACPFCYRVGPTIETLLKDYDGKVRVAYKMFIVHPDTATMPAFAACAAAQQGKYKEMEHELWERGFTKGGYSKELIDTLVKDLKLNAAKFKADMDGDTCKKVIADDMAIMRKFNVNGTPAFFINGRFVNGAQPIEAFKQIIDEELKKADEKIAAGTPAGDYYAKFVVEQGLKEIAAPAPPAAPEAPPAQK